MSSPRLVVADPGGPAFEALRAELARIKVDDALAPATIVVPSNYVGVATRRRLAAAGVDGRPGLAGVTIVTAYRVAELLGAPPLAAAGRRPISTPVLAAAIRAELRRAPGVFGPVAEHVATELALVKAFRELAELEPGEQRTVARQSARAGDVVDVCSRARRALAADWYDEADLIASAIAALDDGPSMLDDLGEILLHLPRRLRRQQGRLLAALGERTALTAVVGQTGVDDDDRRTCQFLRLTWPDGEPAGAPIGLDRVISASDADDEVRAAVRTVVEAVRDGTPLERTAIVFAARDPYARLVHEHLEAAGLPHNGVAVRPVADRMVGRFLLALLRLPERRWRRDAVMGLLAGAPLRTPDRRFVPSAAWEQRSREAGVVAGLDDWRDKLAILRDGLRRTATEEEESSEPREGRIAHRRREADQADDLRTFVVGLADELANAPRTWSGLARWARRLLTELLGTDAMRSRWPDVEIDAGHRVEVALDRLAGLDAIDRSVDREVFSRTLELELESDLGRVGTLGQGVLAGRIDDVLGLDLDLLVVVGLAEGTFPARRLDDSLLPDHERVVAGGALRTRPDDVRADHHDLLAALAAGQSRVLTFPRGDLRKTATRVPSRWLLDLVESRRTASDETGWVRDLPSRPHPDWFVELPSFAGSIQRIAFGGTEQEHRLAVLEHHRTHGGDVATHPVVRADDVLRTGVELRSARASRAFTRFDGNLGGLAIPSPADPGTAMGPTRLETYVKNPHRYLMENILRVEIADDPEAAVQISAMDYGSVVHGALEAFLRDALGSGSVPAPGEPWSDRQVAALLEAAERQWSFYADRGLVGRPVFEQRSRMQLLIDLRHFVEADDAFRSELGVTPIAAELAFGVAEAPLEPVAFDLGDGRTVRFRGSADRVDRAADGRLVVTDYKTGSTRQFDGIEPGAPTAGGTKLQLPVYALAGRAHAGDERAPVHVRYWFVTAKTKFAEIGYDVDERVLDEFRSVLRVIVDEIEAGHFPLRPPEPVWRPWVEDAFADPDGLGTADRWREWERIRDVPELQSFVELAEGIPATGGAPA